MTHCYRLMFRLFSITLLWIGVSGMLSAQTFNGEAQSFASIRLQKVLSSWEVYRIDAASMDQWLQSSPSGSTSQLNLGNRQWSLQLVNSGIISPNYTLQVQTLGGLETMPSNAAKKAFRGIEVNGGGSVRLTIDDDFICGFVREGTEMVFIEPLWWHEKTAAHDLFVVYNASAVNRDLDAGCIALEWDTNIQQNQPEVDDDHGDEPESVLACYELELAIASDRSMFDKYGSVGAVEDHNIAVINNVQDDYNGSFNHDVTIAIITQLVITGTDPWTTSLDAGALLGSFRNWGQGGGFGITFDLGELWTNRDFTGGTVGIAYLNSVCNSTKYHCLQDFTSNAEVLRCMTSHEIGHNFNANHDVTGCPPNFIMCPFVTTSSNWSANSITVISNKITQLANNGCLSSCGPPPPPLVVDFTWSPNPVCQGTPVLFDDNSSGNITGRSWTFQGGAPASSTQVNPVVLWNTPGTYNVTLNLTALGGATASLTQQITINPLPVANFTQTITGTTVNFNNTSFFNTSSEWEFGDGDFSFDNNPVHTYAVGGVYTVKLTVTNDCGTSTKITTINTAPTADFTANPTSGCAPLFVQFSNQSSNNAVSYFWQFPGGSPNQSNQENPTVSYATSGTFNVTLTANNNTGANTIIKTGLITVQNIPAANFTHSVNGLVVTFTNSSVGATSFLWNFGDGGATSTLANPIHTYAVGGTYTVTMTATNACGNTVKTQIVSLIPPPTASFTAAPTSGCAPLTVLYTSTSTGNPSSYNWSFPGGIPSTSTVQNPSVVYNTSGLYSATLIATNAGGNNTITLSNFVNVNGVPGSSFTSNVNGATATFTNTTTNGTTYSWNFGDNTTSTLSNPTHTYTTDGTYTVVLTSTNACGTTTATQTVTVVTPPTAAFTANPTTGCSALTVTFNNQSSANALTYSWTFPGGSPSSSALANPTVVYNMPGQYTVTLVATNSAGTNTAVLTNYINATTVPTAGFTSATNGATVNFSNTSIGGTTYSWNFGDNGSSSQTNPSHTYTTDGTYTVVLTSTNGCGTSTASQTVTIVTPPIPGFTADNTSGCGPLSVQFINQSSANTTSVSWSFPGGTPSTSTQNNPMVVYNNPGTYSVTMTATNSAGSNTATITNLIQVAPEPEAAFTSIQNNATVTFSNSSNDANSYSWFFGDGGTSSLPEPTYTYTTDGVYTIVMVAANACGNDTATQTVTVVLPPTAAFMMSDNEGCAPFSVQFSNESSDNATSFGWTFVGGNPATSNVENPSVNWSQPGIYQAILTTSNAAGTATATSTITVNTLPTAGFTSVTAGLSVQLTNTSTGADSYLWDFGDGTPTSTEENPVHDYGTTGSFTITLKVTNECGDVQFTQSVEIVGSPPAAQFTTESTKGCSPFTVQFNDASIGSPISWSWTFEGGSPTTSTDQNPVVTYATPGVYTVVLEASNLFGSDMLTLVDYITVQDLPQASFSYLPANDTVQFFNLSMNADSYQWNFGDGVGTSMEANPTYVYSAPGTYTVELTAINTCGAATLQQMVVVILVGTNEAEWLNSFRLYPNPNDGSFVIDMVGTPANEVAFTLYDASGRLIKRDVIGFDNGVLRQNFLYQELPQGIYNMHILAGNKSKHVKIIVQR